MDINETYKSLLQHKSEIDNILQSIETSSDPPSVAIQQRLSILVLAFSKNVDSIKAQATKISDPKAKGMWTIRVARFSEDLNFIRVSCDRRLGMLFKTQVDKENRELLFGESNSDSKSSGLMAERMSLNSSHNMMDNITEQSRAVLDRILGQNVTMKNARGKMFDLINNAGAGSTLANLINTREKADALILYGCMVLTLTVFFLLWWFVKR